MNKDTLTPVPPLVREPVLLSDLARVVALLDRLGATVSEDEGGRLIVVERHEEGGLDARPQEEA